jgi:hypothetical protein
MWSASRRVGKIWRQVSQRDIVRWEAGETFHAHRLTFARSRLPEEYGDASFQRYLPGYDRLDVSHLTRNDEARHIRTAPNNRNCATLSTFVDRLKLGAATFRCGPLIK